MLVAMSSIQAPNAASKIQEAIAVHVFEPRVLCAGNIHRRRMRKPARNGGFPARAESTRFRSGNFSLQLNCSHFSIPPDRLFVQVNVHLFGFEIFFDSPRPKLASKARLLVAAPRSFNVSGLHVIDPNDSRPQRFHYAKCFEDIARPNRCCESVGGIVSDLLCVFFIFKWNH